jgi:hypothetical protein
MTKIFCQVKWHGFWCDGDMDAQIEPSFPLFPSVTLVCCSRIGWAFVAPHLASGEARRWRISLVDLRLRSNEARSQMRRNPLGGMSFWFRLRCSLLSDPQGVCSSLTPRLIQKSIAANAYPIREQHTRQTKRTKILVVRPIGKRTGKRACNFLN